MYSEVYLNLRDRDTGKKLSPYFEMHYVYLKGYMNSVLILLRKVFKSSLSSKIEGQDFSKTLIYPALSNLGQGIELMIKYILKINQGFTPSKHENTHDLRNLFIDMHKANRNYFRYPFENLVKLEDYLEKIIIVFEEYSASDFLGFRYPNQKRTKNRIINFENNEKIHTASLLKTSKLLINLFDEMWYFFHQCYECNEDTKSNH